MMQARTYRLFVITLLLLLAGALPLRAQSTITITGMVTNSGDGNKPLDDGVEIYGYSTVAEARDAYQSFVNAWKFGTAFDAGSCFKVYPDHGLYELRLPPTGAILFTYIYSSDVDPQLVQVKGRNQINASFNLAIMLEKSVIRAGDEDDRLIVDDPEPEGNMLPVNAQLPIKKRSGKSDARLGVQLFVLDANQKDTLEFRQAIVMDGKEYHETQLRRMGYSAERDPLMALAEQSPALTDSTDRIKIQDVVELNPQRKRVFIKTRLWMEDYNMVYLTDERQIYDTRRLRRPMRFLEYSLNPNRLDPNKEEYVRRAQRELMNSSSRLDINFLVGQAKVDPRDTASLLQLEKLKDELEILNNTDGTTLKHYGVKGVASPEGNYAKNKALATERLRYIQQQVEASIPAYRRDRVTRDDPDARVAGWEELADLLEADSLLTEASQVREITAKYATIDQQGAQMHKLPFYNTLIKDHLGKLRSVEFTYKYEVFRELTPDEVVDRFRNDADYHSGRKEFTPYEFWVLIQRLTDPEELEPVCRRAVAQAQKQGDEWPLPANILAESYIKRDYVDTTVLAPFVEEFRKGVNKPYQRSNGKFITKNPAEVVANQVIMMMKGEYYKRAVQIAEMLRDEEAYKNLRAVARCLAGYFKPGKPGARETYELIRPTSPRNTAVMDIAMEYWAYVPEEIEALDPQDPVTHYLNAQYQSRQAHVKGEAYEFWDTNVQNDCIRSLVTAFQGDESLLEVAASDFDIHEKLFEDAKKEYENPGSILPPEPEPGVADQIAEKLANMTDEEKKALIMKGINHYEELTDEEILLYEKLSGF